MMKTLVVLWLTLLGLVSTISCHDEAHEMDVPLDCSNSDASRHPSAGRAACKELVQLVRGRYLESQWQEVLQRQEDVAFDCLCGLRSSSLWYYKIMSSYGDMLIAQVVETAARKLKIGGPLYDRIKYIERHPDELAKYRWTTVRDFMDKYRSKESGEPLKQIYVAQRFVEHRCFLLINHPMMDNFIKPTLDALQQSTLYGENREYSILANSPALMRLINLKNFCLNVIGPKEHKELAGEPAEQLKHY